MKNIISLIKKELLDIFTSPIAYVVIATFIILVGLLFAKDVFVYNQASMRNLLVETNISTLSIPLPIVMIFLIPAFTMRSWAEEKKEGTLEILATQPISKIELILGKFLSAVLFTTFLILLTFPIPVTLNILGNPDNGVIAASYIGLILLSTSYIILGQFVSMNTKNQIVAFITSVVLIGILYIVGESWFLIYIPANLRTFFEAFGLGAHFRSIAKGMIDTRDILYYFSLITILFYFIYKSLDRIQKHGQ